MWSWIDEMKHKFDLITSDFTYVRRLGNRKGIEEKTTTWEKLIVDRQGDLSKWVSLLKTVQERRIMILAFAYNHCASCRRRLPMGERGGAHARQAHDRV